MVMAMRFFVCLIVKFITEVDILKGYIVLYPVYVVQRGWPTTFRQKVYLTKKYGKETIKTKGCI